MPIGVQLVGKPFDEETLLKISNIYDDHYKVYEEMIPPDIINVINYKWARSLQYSIQYTIHSQLDPPRIVITFENRINAGYPINLYSGIVT